MHIINKKSLKKFGNIKIIVVYLWKQNKLNFMKKNKLKKHTLLKGEGANQHTLYGEFSIDEKTEFTGVSVLKESDLKHEQPDGSFGEHQTLKIDKGNWVMGKQVEYNPFNRSISQVWD